MVAHRMGVLLALLCIGLVMLAFEARFRLAYRTTAPGRDRIQRFGRLQYEGARLLMAAVKAYAGFRVRVDRRLESRLPETFLLITNHQSLADIPVLMSCFPRHILGFVAKQELARGIPAFSLSLREGPHALIEREGDFRRARGVLMQLAGKSRLGVCPVVFPEGTRTRTGKVGPFHSAAVRTILSREKLPVLSVAIDGGYEISHLRNLITNLRGCVYRIKLMGIHPPMSERVAVQDMLRKSREDIARQVEQWRGSRK